MLNIFYTKQDRKNFDAMIQNASDLHSICKTLIMRVQELADLDRVTKEILTQYKKSLEAAHINAEVSASKADKLEIRIGLLELSNFAHTAAKKRTRAKKSRA